MFDLKAELERRIKEKENEAEEYFQEICDEEAGNRCLAGAAVLQELLDYIKQKESDSNP